MNHDADSEEGVETVEREGGGGGGGGIGGVHPGSPDFWGLFFFF